MRSLAALLVAVPVLALSLSASSDASACGACFHGVTEKESTQVTGHKMIVSISQTQTTLWDQIEYMGAPTSFAWVLPVKGMVDLGLSSDALFENLDQQTAVQISSPPITCPSPPFCGSSHGSSTNAVDAGGGPSGGPPVTVLAQSVVGPYETVTLHSTDPTALATWLTMHGYVIPSGFAPVINAYINEGFDFLALRLIPGMGVTAMKPVRVTTMGATPVLPLRMVAAGVGVTTPITLWVFGEGRYEPTNFPSFVIGEDQIVWDFASSSSNYAALRQAGFDDTNGRGWLLETSAPFSTYVIAQPLQDLTISDPAHSGYADDMGNGAPGALTSDLDKLFGGINATSLWLTRLHAELPRTALDVDLDLGAATSQTVVSPNLTATSAINTPTCPVYTPCNGADGAGGANAAGGAGGNNAGTPGGSGCSVGADPARDAAAFVLALALGLATGRRRRGAKGRGNPHAFPDVTSPSPAHRSRPSRLRGCRDEGG